MAQSYPIGQILPTLPTLQILIAAYFTDVVGTHVCTPEWPGHARYHQAQTFDMLLFFQGMVLYYTWRSLWLPNATSKRESLFVAALCGSAFLITGILAPFFPGRLCLDRGVPPGEPGTPGNWIYGIPLGVTWVGYYLASNKAVELETSIGARKTQ